MVVVRADAVVVPCLAGHLSFTGTGFYSTDYGQGEQKPEPKTPADESVKVLDKGAKKPDEKSTNKPEPE
jgi:hypothetical protein